MKGRKREGNKQKRKRKSSVNFFKNSVRFLSTIILKVNECLRKRKTETNRRRRRERERKGECHE